MLVAHDVWTLLDASIVDIAGSLSAYPSHYQGRWLLGPSLPLHAYGWHLLMSESVEWFPLFLFAI